MSRIRSLECSNVGPRTTAPVCCSSGLYLLDCTNSADRPGRGDRSQPPIQHIGIPGCMGSVCGRGAWQWDSSRPLSDRVARAHCSVTKQPSVIPTIEVTFSYWTQVPRKVE